MKNLENEFPAVKPVHFAHSSVSPIPTRTRDALIRWAEGANLDVSARWDEWSGAIRRTRVLAAGLIGADRDEIALIHNTSHGLLCAANTIDWRPGDNVLGAEHEFPANVYPWTNLRSRGVAYRVVPEREGRFEARDFVDRMDERTRVVAISLVQFTTGFRMPVEAIGRACRERGILFCIDGIQGVGALPVNVREIGCDFLSVGSYKWLLAPEGSGFLYVRRETLSRLNDTMSGWIGRPDPTDYDNASQPVARGAKRFEEGSHALAMVIAFEQSLGLFAEAGVGEVWRSVESLTDRLAAGIESRGLRIISSRVAGEKSGIVSFLPGEHDPSRCVRRIRELGFHITSRRGFLRVAPHFYNTAEQADAFLAALDATLAEASQARG